MKGTGRTVFSGSQVESFDAEILGVLENLGPKQNVILARLSGGPLANTGVLQGMSGSPVYIGGKLIGAVALAFPFAKEAIAGIRPIEEMLETAPVLPRRVRAARSPWNVDLTAALSRPLEVAAGGERMVEISTPMSFSGFTSATLDQFGPALRSAGLSPRQGPGASGRAVPGGDPKSLQPGSMISVQLMSGDMAVGADGTVTHIDGNQIYAFGHRFLSAGGTEMPFARAEVITLLPNLTASFKISSAKEWLGTITQDRNAAIAGELGRKSRLAPLTIAVKGEGGPRSYRMELIRDPVLAPLLVQMAIFSALDGTERLVGASSVSLRGTVEFEGGTKPLQIGNFFTGDSNLPLIASLGAAMPLGYALQSGFEALQLKSIHIEAEAVERKKLWQIDRLWTSQRRARPGEEVEIGVALTGENGAESTRKIRYRIPEGASPGLVFITAADAGYTNFVDLQPAIASPPNTAGDVLSLLERLRPNDKAYVTLWRPEPGYPVQGRELPDPPPSAALILGRQQTSQGAQLAWRGSKIREFDLNPGSGAVAGSKTIQLEIRE
ncbi:MAG: hypothetical protein K2X35_23080 [Bryobacteraceae bacterium]|nr:hypothetical protein [Bryobacteraceae bacterium]